MTMTSLAPWFTESRLGLFIHWGLYSLPARHEWVMNREQLSVEDYSKYFDAFDPDLYDPQEWAAAAAQAGMKYAVLTTKHHEGFCLWDSSLTDYTVINTPYGKDLIAPYVEALRDHGLKVGFYYSVIDWHHPDFAIDVFHPQRNHPDRDELNSQRDAAAYREYLHGQVRELMRNYGQIDYLFFDFSYDDGAPADVGGETIEIWGGKSAEAWGSTELLAMVRQLQPGIVVNDRLGIAGDFATPEQYQPSAPMTDSAGNAVVWEANQTLNGSWGYDRDNLDYKSPDLVIRMLIDGVSKDGNLLLNVGPTGRGTFDPRATAILDGLGDWMRLHSRAIYGAGASEFTPPVDARYTQRGDRLYLHLFSWPFGHLHLPGLAGKVRYAQLLNDASEVHFMVIPADAAAHQIWPGGQPDGTLTLQLPVQRPHVAVPVIELFLA